MYENFCIKEGNLKPNKNNYSSYIIESEENPEIKIPLNTNELLLEQFWYALALCHTCSIQLNEKGIEEYACVSPDSIELVKAAREQGWKFSESGTNSIKRIQIGIGNNKEEIIDFERLQLIEFSSDRKRETVIVKKKNSKNNINNDIIKLYCKGADSIIEERLSNKTPKIILNQCKYYVNKFSALGFRTLFIAMKILSQEEYDKFNLRLKNAQNETENKEQKISQVYEDIEKDLFLLGTTIVEDKLQDLVPETIRDLRLAKIKVWMLTGDKMNTAYNIGLSCNLISKKMKTFNICGIEKKKNTDLKDINKEERCKVISDFAKEFHGYKNNFDTMEKPSFGILVDEKALLTINEDNDSQKIFLEIAKDAEAVICCRVSPLQKSQVVKMMKKYDKNGITLAIGDGGNDVPMIMEAHIGVGIYGEEGLRAVQSSDYAIGEFKILRELLFSHGRMNYVRNSECIHYFFLKNFVQTFNHFIYGFYCNFTGQTIIDDWYITLYNLLFTSLPLGAKAILDTDIKRDDGIIVYKMLPFIYKENRDVKIFTIFNFLLNLSKGLIFSFINTFFVIYSIYNIHINKDGQMAGLWFMSVDIYTNILIIVSVTMLVTTKFHTWINVVILLVVTFISYVIFLIIVQHLSIFNSVGTMDIAFKSPILWLNLFLICGFCGLIDYFLLSFNYVFNPNTVLILKRILSERGSNIDDNNNLPKSIIEKINIYDNIEDKINEEYKIDTRSDKKVVDKVEVQKINDNDFNDKTQEIINSDERKVFTPRSKGVDENSEEIFIKKRLSGKNTPNGVDVVILNQKEDKENNKNENSDDDLGENFNDSFSEKMSKEKNLYFSNDNYFSEPWNFKQKIIQRKQNLEEP